MVLYTVVIRYSKSKQEVNAVLEAHRSYLDGFLGGMLLASGPLDSGDGGVLWVKADSREHLTEMIEGDPYFVAQVAEFSVLAFDVKKIARPFAEILGL